MNKILCRNNLSMVGERRETRFLSSVVIAVLILGANLSHAYEIETIPSMSSYQPTEFKLNLNPISNINDTTLPINNLINEAIQGLRLNQSINMGTWIPISPIKSPSRNIDFSRFFGSSKVSPGDVISFLREAAITGINLSILIISITTQVLKGLLSAIK